MLTTFLTYLLVLPVLLLQLTTSSLITAISAILIPITAIRGADTLAIAASKCSTSTGICTNYMKQRVLYIALILAFMSHEQATIKINGKLTAVSLITSIRA